MKQPILAQQVDDLASQCVKCALCLPHCPTYELTEDENESPRGRIALFQAIAKNQLPLSPKAYQHIDQCLGCRACERVCPAHVKYGSLLTHGRALFKTLPEAKKLKTKKPTVRFLATIATHPLWLAFLHYFLWLVQLSGLRYLGEKLGLVRLLGMENLNQLMPDIKKPLDYKTLYRPKSKQDAVSLFTGCMTSLADQETLKASIFVLNKLGYEVHIPKTQNCCGAIAIHAGEMDEALRLAQQNSTAFKPDLPVLSTATGCSAVLQEYGDYFSLGSSLKVQDIVSFVLQCSWPADLVLKPLNLNVLLHTPCTRRNVLKTPGHPEQLLAKIPNCQWQSFRSMHCCGAAGTYMLEHPDLAIPLAEQLLQECQDKPIDVLCTTNIGCALHLSKQLKTKYPHIKVYHPITLLARALSF